MSTVKRRARTTATAEALGARLRSVRHSRNMTLTQVGARSGLSHAFLSQVERGLASPSMSTLHGIADALDVPAAVLLSDTASGRVDLVRAGEGRRLDFGPELGDVVVRALTGENQLLKVSEFTGAFPSTEVFAHGGEEHVYVLSGKLEIAIAGEPLELGPGDALTFDCSDPHTYVGLTEDLHFLLVVADPGEFASPLDESTLETRRAKTSLS
jgi:transcriptional regulator with XRE-family HTH domain